MAFFTFMATVILGYLQYRTGKKVEEVRHATNSLTDRLVATTREEAHAAGIKEEKERGQT